MLDAVCRAEAQSCDMSVLDEQAPASARPVKSQRRRTFLCPTVSRMMTSIDILVGDNSMPLLRPCCRNDLSESDTLFVSRCGASSGRRFQSILILERCNFSELEVASCRNASENILFTFGLATSLDHVRP